MLEQYEKKKSEYQEWSSVVEQAVSQKDAAAKEAVQVFQKIKKHVFRCTLSQMRGSRGFDLLNNYCLCTSAHAKKLLFVLGCLSNLHTHTCTVCCSSCLGAHRCCMAQRKRKCSMRCSLLCCLHATSYACLSCNSAYSLSKQSESSTSPSCVHQHACLHLQQASRSLWQHCSPSVSDIAKNGVWQDCFSVQCFASKVPTHGYCGAWSKLREVRAKEEGGEDKADEILAELRSKRGVLSETLSKLEVETREILLELLAEFDRRYSDIAEVDRSHFTTYFATVSPRSTPPLPPPTPLLCIIPSASALPPQSPCSRATKELISKEFCCLLHLTIEHCYMHTTDFHRKALLCHQVCMVTRSMFCMAVGA